ncbi:MAG: hypothetical protein KGJ59_07100 [Bacteroidota bacterium]|nr:hypothetical protein [Bacteroidota bacterium]
MSKHRVIPESELHCIWMEAGVTDYKLCDRKYRCEECPFDSEMRKFQSEINSPFDLEQKPVVTKKRHATAASFHAQAEPPAGNEDASICFSRLCDEEIHTLLKHLLPCDRTYFRNHTWVKYETPSLNTMGVDHIGAHFLQQIVSVVLPDTPTQVGQNSPFVWLVFREGTIALRSGIQGTITETNGELLDHPLKLATDPYNAGWILRISIPMQHQLQKSLTLNTNLPALKAELAGIKSNLMAGFQYEQTRSITLYDGGRTLKSIHEIIGEKKYFEIVNNFLSHNV